LGNSLPAYRPTAVDVFAGAGGLTVGLKRAGFKVAAAVEIDEHAFATYKTNHPEVKAFRQDVRTVKGVSLKKASGGTIDVLAGCPPCQGFSTLTNTSSKKDPRNNLVLEVSRLIEEIRPDALMLENVPGLAGRGKHLFNKLLKTLDRLKYKYTWDVLQVADYGVPQNRRRLVLLAGKGFELKMPPPTHSRTGANGLPKWLTLRDAIFGMGAPAILKNLRETGGPQSVNWHVVRDMGSQNLARLKATKPGESRAELPDHLRPDCHKAMNKGYSNVYGRMTWDQLPVTITGGCTTLSKGRFGHPSELRALSVREAARIQTFPDDYVFDSQFMDHVCEMIGNALPCDFAEKLSASVAGQLSDRRAAKERRRIARMKAQVRKDKAARI
jgi:DNA (cytosine-5)-methyltransferase 1